NLGRGNFKQFQYQKDVCHINKGKRPSYEVGTTRVQKKARNLKVKQNHQVVSNSRSRSSTRKPLRNLETSNENIQEKKAEALARNMKEKEIQRKVESRFGMMNGDRKIMLLSLLNKPVNKIKIDRVLKEEENFYQNSELVLKRQSKEWEEEYRAKSWINPSWYQNILDPIQEEEWLAALNKAHNKTALGVLGIGYILLKK
ncbi:17052_t:CDS:2, partial [Gigaspora margarita]